MKSISKSAFSVEARAGRGRPGRVCRASLVLLAAVSVILPAGAARAEDLDWIHYWYNGSGYFDDISHWITNTGIPWGWPPAEVDIARFGWWATLPATISFRTDPTNVQMDVASGVATFDLQGHIYSLSDPYWGVRVGAMAGFEGGLVLNGGTLMAVNSCVGYDWGSEGEVTVNADARWENSGQLHVGLGGQGMLHAWGGGLVGSQHATLGIWPTGEGEADVQGAGSRWINTGCIYVGGSSIGPGGVGRLRVRDGGALEVGDLLRIYSGGMLELDGGSVTTRSLDVLAGATFTHLDGTLTVRGGTCDLGGADLTVNGRDPKVVLENISYDVSCPGVVVGSLYEGTLVVRGATVLTSNSGVVGADGGSEGKVTVEGGATWTNTGTLHVGFAGTGVLVIRGGGGVNANEIHIGAGGGAGRLEWYDGSVSTPGLILESAGTLAMCRDFSLSALAGGAMTGGGVGLNQGTLEITNGAAATLGDATAVAVGNLRLGSELGSGALTILPDSYVYAAGNVSLWSPASSLTIDGGTLSAGGLDAPAGSLIRLRDPPGAQALTLGSSSDGEVLGDLLDGAGGSGGLRKVGSGRLTLLGVNGYTGPTLVDEGALALPNGLGIPGATITVAAGAELEAANVVNRALAGSGAVTATGWLVIGDGGSTAGVDLAGTLNVGANNVLLLDADVAQLGAATLLAAGGKLDSFNGSRLGPGDHADPAKTLTAAGEAVVDGDFCNNGEVNGPGGTEWLTFADDVTGAGAFTGNVRFKGQYSPGASPAAVSFGGNLAFTGSAALLIELGGTDPGSGHDQLNVAGNAALGGTLHLSLIDGFTPEVGDEFGILTSATRTGEFGAMTGWQLGNLSLVGLYAADGLALKTTYTGDATLDGKVDYVDLGILATHYDGTQKTWAEGDFTGDRLVNYVDLGVLATYYGEGCPTVATPEPATLALLGLGGLAVLRRRRVRA